MEAHGQLLAELLTLAPADPTYRLGPIAALREVVAVCGSIQAGRSAPNSGDRRSLQGDVQLALTSIGEELRRQLEPTWKDFYEGELAGLPSLLDGGVGRLRSAAEVLVELLLKPASAQAAWRDLFELENRSVTVDQAKHLAAVLREIDESRGHEWAWRLANLRQAGFSESTQEGDELLGADPSSTAKVAWFVFADADLTNTMAYLRVGQVQFFSGRLWPAGVMSREHMALLPGGEFPAELDEEALDTWFTVGDSSEFLVYARVELDGPRAGPGRTPHAHQRPAAAWARNLVASVVEAGSFRFGGTHWRLLEGEAVFHQPGGWSGSGDFHDPRVDEEIQNYRHPLNEGTGDGLEELDPRVADLIAEGDRSATTAVEEARWYEAARVQGDPAQRLVLHVRAFERALPVGVDFHWDEAVSRYLKDFWAVEALGDEVFRLAWQTHGRLRGRAAQDLDKLEQWYVDQPPNGFHLFPGAFMRVAEEVYGLLPQEMRLARREMKQVVRWAASTEAAAARTEQWGGRFSLLLNRALRQRNATIHGVTTVPEVVASVDAFIARIAALVVTEAIHSAGTGDDLVQGLERGRVRSRRTLWRLDEGDGTPDRILFTPEDPS